MTVNIYLNDGTILVATSGIVDVVHSTVDPSMIKVVNGSSEPLFWVTVANFKYAQAA